MGPAGQVPSLLETIEDASLQHTRDLPLSGDSEPLPPPPDMPRRPAATSAAGSDAATARATGRGHRLSRLRVGSASPSGDEGGGLRSGEPSGGAHSGGGDQRVRAGSSSPALPSDATAPPWQPWSPEEAERALSMAASSVSGAVFRMSESQVNFDGCVSGSGSGSGGNPLRPALGNADRDPAASGAAVRQYDGTPGPLGEAFEEWDDSGGSSPLPQTPRDAVSSPSVAAGPSFLGRGDKSVRKMSQYRSRGMTVSQQHCYTNA